MGGNNTVLCPPLRGNEQNKNECAVGQLRCLCGAVSAVPLTAWGVTSPVAATVRKVLVAIRGIDRAALSCRGNTVKPVVKTLLTVAFWVTLAILEDCIAPVAMFDGGAVCERSDLIGAFVVVKTTGVGIALHLQGT